MAAPQRTAMINVLTTCGFGIAAQRNFIINDEGLDRFLSFTMISYEDLAHITKNASRHPPPLLNRGPQNENACCFEVLDLRQNQNE